MGSGRETENRVKPFYSGFENGIQAVFEGVVQAAFEGVWGWVWVW